MKGVQDKRDDKQTLEISDRGGNSFAETTKNSK